MARDVGVVRRSGLAVQRVPGPGGEVAGLALQALPLLRLGLLIYFALVAQKVHRARHEEAARRVCVLAMKELGVDIKGEIVRVGKEPHISWEETDDARWSFTILLTGWAFRNSDGSVAECGHNGGTGQITATVLQGVDGEFIYTCDEQPDIENGHWVSVYGYSLAELRQIALANPPVGGKPQRRWWQR